MQKIINFALILLIMGLARATPEAEIDRNDPYLLMQIVGGMVTVDFPEGHQSDIVASLHSLEDAMGVQWPITDGASKFPWLLTHIPAYKIRSVKLLDPRYVLVLYSGFDYQGDRCVVYRKSILNVSGKCFDGPIASAKIFYVGESYQNRPVTDCVIPSDQKGDIIDCNISAKISYFTEYSTESDQKRVISNYLNDDYICQRILHYA